MGNKGFIAKIAPLIQKYAGERGYRVCSAAIAQACLESNYGKSGLAKYHNYFGLKCGSSWKGASVNMNTKEEYKPGTLTTIRDNFRVYGSVDEGVKGYYDFIAARRFANLKEASSARQYLEYIKADGYATASDYVNANMAVVNRYHLTEYDGFENAKENCEKAKTALKPKQIGNYKVGETYALISNMVVRDSPGGAKVKYCDLTDDAKRHGHASVDGGAVLEKETRVTCRDVVNREEQIWLRIPSGWICAVGGTGIRFVI